MIANLNAQNAGQIAPIEPYLSLPAETAQPEVVPPAQQVVVEVLADEAVGFK